MRNLRNLRNLSLHERQKILFQEYISGKYEYTAIYLANFTDDNKQCYCLLGLSAILLGYIFEEIIDTENLLHIYEDVNKTYGFKVSRSGNVPEISFLHDATPYNPRAVLTKLARNPDEYLESFNQNDINELLTLPNP